MRDQAELLSGSLAAFSADEVVQWMAHHPDDLLIHFEPSRASSGSRRGLSIHVRRGMIVSIKTHSADGPDVREDGRLGRANRDGESAEPDQASEESRDGLQPREGLLGGLLVRNGLVDAGRLRFALAVQRKHARKGDALPLGRTLCALGLLGGEALDGALREMALQHLAEICCCDEGRFCVVRGSLPEPNLSVEEPVDAFLLQSVHRADSLGDGTDKQHSGVSE